ncbi:TcpQ domain-containing protein [Rahnella sp. ChDrAdgB13]|uniref:PFGI-1 class ICE element type IV pilus protein PilL2 n=1 Tax=Rahnella sp. ChDrAdgB13 TaxID=1850581 RepID=UPI001AD88683|nr:TcpQ domain-containing protein [Rahnella sp. ChDrAdgB13]
MAKLTQHPGRKLAWLTLSLLTAGCTHNSTSSDRLPRISANPRVSDIYQSQSPEVVRYDKYTLVSTRPADAQRDPLNQMVDITMPAQLVRSVGDGFRYLLLESGYSLCPASSAVFTELLSRPLPAVQRSIGPVRLNEALQILAGPAWRLRVDDVNREVCFTLRDAYRDFAPRAATPVSSRLPTTAAASPRLSGNPFTAPSVSASNTNPAASLLPVPAAGQPKPVLKPENVPVPSPVLTTVKKGTLTGNVPPVATKRAPAVPSAAQQRLTVRSSIKTSSPSVVATGSKPALTTQTSPVPKALPVQNPSISSSDILFGTPVTVVPSGQLWRAEVGSTLKETLTRWAGSAKCDNGGNWVVIWPVSLDYRIDAPLTFHGNFESVLVQVFDLYRQADKPLYAAASRMQCLVSVSDQPGRH